MLYPQNHNIHRPPHRYLDDTYYFITARTVNGNHDFDTLQKKKILKRVLIIAVKKFKVSMFAWVVLANHYHLLVKLQRKEDLAKFIQNIHTNSSRELNSLENKPGRKIWYQYWDHSIQKEEDFWRHFNYIHQNLIKHGYCSNLGPISLYPFSSYRIWLKKKGSEWLKSCFEKYPIIDFTVEEDE